MKLNKTFLLRIAVTIILLMHSIRSIFNGGVNDFRNLYLNQQGFGVLGLPLAWAIKLSHIVAAVCLLLEKYVKWAGELSDLLNERLCDYFIKAISQI